MHEIRSHCFLLITRAFVRYTFVLPINFCVNNPTYILKGCAIVMYVLSTYITCMWLIEVLALVHIQRVYESMCICVVYSTLCSALYTYSSFRVRLCTFSLLNAWGIFLRGYICSILCLKMLVKFIIRFDLWATCVTNGIRILYSYVVHTLHLLPILTSCVFFSFCRCCFQISYTIGDARCNMYRLAWPKY